MTTVLINNNLEEQAKTLFKNDFIDYAPYGSEKPFSWQSLTLNDVCVKITDGSHYSPKDSPTSLYKMYSVKDMETFGFNESDCKHISEEDYIKMVNSDCVPKVNDILVAKDGSYLKEVFICCENKKEAILSSIAIFRPNLDIILPEFLLYYLKQPTTLKDVADNYVSGSALPRIVLKDFKKYKIIVPPLDEQKRIGNVLKSIRFRIKNNIDENQRLIKVRDTLLPKLMSGELDVSNLES